MVSRVLLESVPSFGESTQRTSPAVFSSVALNRDGAPPAVTVNVVGVTLIDGALVWLHVPAVSKRMSNDIKRGR